jgi:hypothetical protein
MLKTQNIEHERREYYRFDESLMISYSIVGKQTSSVDLAQFQAMELLNTFSSMTGQLKMSLSRMQNRSPESSNCFKILDAKINLLAQTVLYQNSDNNLKARKVTISAGGISFGVDEAIEAGTQLSLQLVLPPELNVLSISANVLKCHKSTDNNFPYYISTKFYETNDVTEDTIVRHIMRVQSDQLRAKKEA